jgi:antitoxin (DNA-binding transcriptional repressor) of toxin-antitoxin stability system
MKTITIPDLRQRWPEAEAALQVENEILIARDAQPVARLVRVSASPARCLPWNPAVHTARIRKILGAKIFPGVAALLAETRADRKLGFNLTSRA